MRIGHKIFGRFQREERTLRLGGQNTLTVLGMGFVAGVILANLAKDILLHEMGLFDEYTLSLIKYQTIDHNAFFYYVFWKRILFFLCLAAIATTYLGKAACTAVTAGIGMSVGLFLTVLTLRYGLKGQVLAVVWMFPQFLLYTPAFMLLIGWCEKIYNGIYGENGLDGMPLKGFFLTKLAALMIIIFLAVGGCLLESYLNPEILKAYLNIF